MRLAGRVPDLRHPRRGRGGEQRGFRSGHRRFVQIDRRRPEAIGGFERVSLAVDLADAHGGERLEVGRDRAARRDITAGRRQARAPAAREQRTDEEDRPAQAADQRRVGFVLHDLRAAHAQRRAADPLDLGPEIQEQPRHHFHVADARHVGEDAFLGREETRREQRQRGVLVAFDLDRAGETLAAFNQ